MKKLIIAEKFSVTCELASKGRTILGDFYLPNGILLTKEYYESHEEEVKQIVNKAMKLENDNYILMFAKGHLLDLYGAKDYDETFKNWKAIPNDYIPNEFKYKVSTGKQTLINAIRDRANQNDVSEIINCTDADREGEHIFYRINDYIRFKKPIKRLWINSFEKEGIEQAFAQIKNNTEYFNLQKSGVCRSNTDWILGALLTAHATTKLSGDKDLVSVGRCQTAILNELVAVEQERKVFKPKTYYKAVAIFNSDDGDLIETIYDDVEFSSHEEVSAFSQSLNMNGIVKKYEIEEKNVYCDLLFNQTDLQVHMANNFNITPNDTLALCQELYTKGYLTYPRTSSNYISESDVEKFEKILEKLKSINSFAERVSLDKNNKRIVNTDKVESHIAILPTLEIPQLEKLSEQEKLVYLEVVKRMIAINFECAIDQYQKIEVMLGQNLFKGTGKKEVKSGFREIYDIIIENTSIPTQSENKILQLERHTVKETTTQKRKRYTYASILKLMQKYNVGTDATRSSILARLEQNGCIENSKKNIIPTGKGLKIIEILPIEEMKSLEFTGLLENDLDQVEKGLLNETVFMNKINALYLKLVQDIQLVSKNYTISEPLINALGKCPICNEGKIQKRNGQYGVFYSCTNYKNGCKYSLNKIRGKELTEKQVTSLLEGKKVTLSLNGQYGAYKVKAFLESGSVKTENIVKK